MKIVLGWPPNIKLVMEHFPIPRDVAVYFTYGDSLYSPRVENVPAKIIQHEKVHEIQQRDFKDPTYTLKGPDAWWRKYIDDVQFRLEQEYAAYGAQVKYIRETKGSAAAQNEADLCSAALSSPVYGDIISKEAAKIAILKYSIL